MISAIAEGLWERDRTLDLQVFEDEADHSGFDLVLGCNSIIRYIQIEQAYLKQNFSQVAEGLPAVIVYVAVTLENDYHLFFVGPPDAHMPGIEDSPVTLSPGSRSAEGVRKIRENYRDVPLKDFQGPLTVPQLVDLLFPNRAPRPTRCLSTLEPVSWSPVCRTG